MTGRFAMAAVLSCAVSISCKKEALSWSSKQSVTIQRSSPSEPAPEQPVEEQPVQETPIIDHTPQEQAIKAVVEDPPPAEDQPEEGPLALNIAFPALTLVVNIPMIPELMIDRPIPPNAPGCSVTPNLPPGLRIDARKCTILGTPTNPEPQNFYTVILTNSDNSVDTKTISIEVIEPNIDPPKPTLAYVSEQLALTVGVAMPPEQPQTGMFSPGLQAQVASCLSNPALPPGVTVDSNTCVVSGTPTAPAAAATYTITLTNNYGRRASDTITITIADAPSPPPPTPPTPQPFSFQFDFNQANNFRCDGGECQNSPNIAIGGGRAASVSTPSIAFSLTIDWVPQAAAMVIYYPFNGDATNERSGGLFSGIAHGNVHAGDPGKVGTGATFDGNGDYYDTGYARRFSTTDSFSVVAWTKYSGSNQERHVFGAASTNDYFFEYSIHSSNFYRGYLRSRDNPRIHTEVGRGLKGSTSVNDNRWHHFTFVWDATGNGLVGRVYDDGVLAHSQSYSRGNWRELDFSRTPFYLGARNNGGSSPNGYVDGQVDEFGFWTEPLTDQEVQEIYSRQAGIKYNGGYFVNAAPVAYQTLQAVAITATPGCTSFQASPDGGATFYHKTGGSWMVANGTNDATDANNTAWADMSDFPIGTGNFVLKMIMADGFTPCTISKVLVTGQRL